MEFLGDFHGILISDGFGGYNKLLNVIRAGCWAHMQRKWREAMPKGEIGKKSVAAQGYKLCNRLFRLERNLEELSDADRQAKRQEKAKPIIDEYYAWIETITCSTGKLKEAVTYALNQKEFLCTFLDHGEIEISNNQVENAIRLKTLKSASNASISPRCPRRRVRRRSAARTGRSNRSWSNSLIPRSNSWRSFSF